MAGENRPTLAVREKPWLELNPLVTGTDGFFVAVIEKH